MGHAPEGLSEGQLLLFLKNPLGKALEEHDKLASVALGKIVEKPSDPPIFGLTNQPLIRIRRSDSSLSIDTMAAEVKPHVIAPTQEELAEQTITRSVYGQEVTIFLGETTDTGFPTVIGYTQTRRPAA